MSKSQSGRSKDVRRIYHSIHRPQILPRVSMKSWARQYVTIARSGTQDDGQLARVGVVAQWLSGKGVRS